MADDPLSPASTYLAYLPATLAARQSVAADGTPALDAPNLFLRGFLRAFERILSGLPDLPTDDTTAIVSEAEQAVPPGLEQVIGALATYFVPVLENSPGGAGATPDDFLPWLAGWVSVSLRDDWPASTSRQLIRNAVSLYRMRGTRQCLTTVLNFYLPQGSNLVVDDSSPLANFFTVTFQVAGSGADLARYDRVVRAIIDQEKPAHTYYSLEIRFQTMRLVPWQSGTPLRIRESTILGVGLYTPAT